MRNDNLLAGGRRFREHRPLHGIPRITNQESSRTSEDCVGTPGRSKITELQPKTEKLPENFAASAHLLELPRAVLVLFATKVCMVACRRGCGACHPQKK